MTQGLRLAAIHCALLAMVLRALLPMGWMPDARGGLAICSLSQDGAQAALGAIHHDGAPGHDGGHQNGHEECPFAAAPHLASVPELPQMTLPSLHAAQAAADTARAGVIAARFSPQSPRAPPASA